jgi:hypothetical protein
MERPEGKRLLVRLSNRWWDKIKIDLQEVGRIGTDRIDLAQDSDRWRALLNAALNLWVPLNGGGG